MKVQKDAPTPSEAQLHFAHMVHADICRFKYSIFLFLFDSASWLELLQPNIPLPTNIWCYLAICPFDSVLASRNWHRQHLSNNNGNKVHSWENYAP